MFCHSLVSDWNHGNAHFLRGIATELLARGHRLTVLEPSDAWSRSNLVADAGQGAIDRFHRAFPTLASYQISLDRLDLDHLLLHDADVVLVHEWNDPALVAAIGRHRATTGGYRLFFHDTHHRSVSRPEEMATYELQHYDGVLAFGEVIRRRYLEDGLGRAGVDLARSRRSPAVPSAREPTSRRRPGLDRRLGRRGAYGGARGIPAGARHEPGASHPDPRGAFSAESARPSRARRRGVRRLDSELQRAGGVRPLPGHGAHPPRRAYAESLPGIPTIRLFEALAWGIHRVNQLFRIVADLNGEGDELITDSRRGGWGEELTPLRMN
jgi:hypothetical protein